jgi:hypothetical protein
VKITWQLTVTLFFAYFSCTYVTDRAKLDHTTVIKQWMKQNVNINAKVHVALSILKRPKAN